MVPVSPFSYLRKKGGAPAVGSGAAAAKSKQPPSDKSQRALMALHEKLKATGAVNEKVSSGHGAA